MMKHQLQQPAFTLAELLIALAILGVIATFTIPKILDSGSSSEWNAKAKEAASMIAAAHQQLKLDGQLSAATTEGDITPYLNYVRIDTTSTIDHVQTFTTRVCSTANALCVRLHNGGVFYLNTNTSFNDTSTTSGFGIHFDPDGVYSGSATGEGKSVTFILYYNGRLVSRATAEPNSCNSNNCFGPEPSYDPPWFSWSN